MMLTFLELAYMFDATQDYGVGCREKHNSKWKHNIAEKTTQKNLPAAVAWEPGSGKHIVNFTTSSQSFYVCQKEKSNKVL